MDEVSEHSGATPDLAGSDDLWCNFCGYSSRILSDYLAHSCIEVLEAKGKVIEPTGQTECR